MKPVSILVPNRFSWDGIVLTTESVLKRTNYPFYDIIVCDNSQSPWNPSMEPPRQLDSIEDDGSRLEYLRDQARQGNIRLIEVTEQYKNWKHGGLGYGHGENIKRLLAACETPYAMLLSSGTEVVNPDWLMLLVNMLRRHNGAIGVARINEANRHFGACYIAPRIVPNWMLLDMEKYHQIEGPDDWSLQRIPLSEYKHQHILEDLGQLTNPESDPPRVFLDTGWRLYEKVFIEQQLPGYYFVPLPPRYVRNRQQCMPDTFMLFFGGMDRNAYRPSCEHIVKRREEIARRLRLLRA